MLERSDEIHIRPGFKVMDASGEDWVYIGYRVTSRGTHSHWFTKLGEFNDEPWTYSATYRRTLIKKFPSLAEHYES